MTDFHLLFKTKNVKCENSEIFTEVPNSSFIRVSLVFSTKPKFQNSKNRTNRTNSYRKFTFWYKVFNEKNVNFSINSFLLKFIKPLSENFEKFSEHTHLQTIEIFGFSENHKETFSL